MNGNGNQKPIILCRTLLHCAVVVWASNCAFEMCYRDHHNVYDMLVLCSVQTGLCLPITITSCCNLYARESEHLIGIKMKMSSIADRNVIRQTGIALLQNSTCVIVLKNCGYQCQLLIGCYLKPKTAQLSILLEIQQFNWKTASLRKTLIVRSFSKSPHTDIILSLLFIALHGMQTRSCDENSVRPSVRPSVKRVNCDKTAERYV